jgi:hypothetical protein
MLIARDKSPAYLNASLMPTLDAKANEKGTA